MAKYKTVI